MTLKTLFGVGMGVAALLIPAGCDRRYAPAEAGVTATAERPARVKGSASSQLTAPVTPPAARIAGLPEGTALVVRTTTALSTKTNVQGESFTAFLDQPVIVNGVEMAPKGSELAGRIVASDKGGRVKGRASLAVTMVRLNLASGRAIDIRTNTLDREANPTKGKDALKVGIGSGVGAAIGAIAGGGKGAAIGAGVGAGAGSGVVLATYGDSAVIPSETVLHFVLSAPATL